MPTPLRQLLSQTSYDADGTTTVWNFSFSGGYLNKSHVKAEVRDTATGNLDQIPVTLPMFLGDFQLNITPALPIGSVLTIYRNSLEDGTPIVDFADTAALTETSLDVNAQQAIFCAAEATDRINTSLVDASVQLAIDAAQAADLSRVQAQAAATAAGNSATLAGSYADSSLASANAAAASAAEIAGGPVISVAGLTGIVSGGGLKTAIALDQVDNTTDATKPVSSAQATAIEAARSSIPAGQGRLTLSGGNLVLSRYNGLMIYINGKNETIPQAGVSLAPTGIVANTLYFIYAFMSAGVLTLERSTTVPSTDTATGVRIKSADPSRTLVGMAITSAGGVWVDIPAYRGVLSWYNQLPIECAVTLGGNIGTASGALVEVDSGYRISFLTWGGAVARTWHSGSCSNSSIATFTLALTRISGVLGTGALVGTMSFTSAGADYVGNAAINPPPVKATADGLATIGFLAGTAGGTVTIRGGGTNSTMSAQIQG